MMLRGLSRVQISAADLFARDLVGFDGRQRGRWPARLGYPGVARRSYGREDAEDVAQEALLLAFKALPSIEEPSKFAAWLSAITRHRAWRFGKRESLHKAGRVELDEVLLENIDALSRPFVQEGNEELNLALERVADDYALVLRMRFLDEIPLKRISAFLGVPVSTVKWRVHQGKKLLREALINIRGE